MMPVFKLAPTNDNHDHASAINLFAASCHAASRRAGWYTDLTTGKGLGEEGLHLLAGVETYLLETRAMRLKIIGSE